LQQQADGITVALLGVSTQAAIVYDIFQQEASYILKSCIL